MAKTEVPKGSEAEAKKEAVSYSEDDIAVIGFSGRFPDASNIEEFWKNLKAGKDSVRVLPEERFHTSKFYSEDGKAANKSYCVSGGYLENVAYFDASFFNISPLEAQYMDPQSRLFWKRHGRPLNMQVMVSIKCQGQNVVFLSDVCKAIT